MDRTKRTDNRRTGPQTKVRTRRRTTDGQGGQQTDRMERQTGRIARKGAPDRQDGENRQDRVAKRMQSFAAARTILHNINYKYIFYWNISRSYPAKTHADDARTGRTTDGQDGQNRWTIDTRQDDAYQMDRTDKRRTNGQDDGQ